MSECTYGHVYKGNRPHNFFPPNESISAQKVLIFYKKSGAVNWFVGVKGASDASSFYRNTSDVYMYELFSYMLIKLTNFLASAPLLILCGYFAITDAAFLLKKRKKKKKKKRLKSQ